MTILRPASLVVGFLVALATFVAPRAGEAQVATRPLIINIRSTLNDTNEIKCTRVSPGSLGAIFRGRAVTAIASSELFPSGDKGWAGSKRYGSFTVRNLFPATPQQPEHVASYLFDGKIDSGPHFFQGPKFMITGFANYQGLCHDGSPRPPSPPTAAAPVRAKLIGACGMDQDLGLELSDSAGVFATGRFRANVVCDLTDTAPLNTTLDVH